MLKVKIFDEEHEEDLEEVVNNFLEELDERQFRDIKYQVAVTNWDDEEEIYCFSAMIIYKT